jgi:hypothetical protein
MKSNARNTLTIAETKDILCAEHAGRMFVAECWWAIVPNQGNSYASTGDASSFWALINATLELGQPLGFKKVENHLGDMINQAHSDPELVLRKLILPKVRAGRPDFDIIEARCKFSGKDAKEMYKAAMEGYNAELQAAEKRTEKAIIKILNAKPNPGDEIVNAEVEAYNEETTWDDDNGLVTESREYGEWTIPIDRIIDFAERQQKFLASNPNIPDLIFGTENTLWEGELNLLKHIIQQPIHEGAGEGSREIDEALLNSAGMQAGMDSGK